MRLLFILVPVFLSLQVAGAPNLTDTLPDHNVNTLSKLQEGDTLSIHFRSQGCWHRSEARVVITRKGEHLVAQLVRGESFNVFTRGRAKPPVDSLAGQEVILTDEQLRVYARFEQELRAVTESGCTTTGYYEVSSKHLQLKRSDGSCQWNGFTYLTKAFFERKEEVGNRFYRRRPSVPASIQAQADCSQKT